MKIKDLTNLLKWNKKVDIVDKDGNILDTIYVRLVGDLDYQTAQKYALVSSRKTRKNLHDENTIEYESLFFDIDVINKKELVSGILISEVGNFRDQALDELGADILDMSDFGDNPTLEERETQEEEEEDSAKKRIKLINDKMNEKQEKRREELNKMTIKDLREAYMKSMIDLKCMESFTLVFREYCCFAGSFSDIKFTKRVFNAFDDFRNLSPIIKKQLFEAYMDLEINGEQLKN